MPEPDSFSPGRPGSDAYGGGELDAFRLGSVAAPVDREQLPVAFDALQGPGAAIVQDEVGADDQVAHGPGDKDLIGLGGRHDPGGDVQGHPTNIAVAQLHLADVQPGADLHRDAAELIPKGNRAVDSPPWAVEGGQDPVAGGLDQAAACLLDQPVGQLDQFRASDVVGQVLAMAGGHEGGVASVQDQRWRLDQGQQGRASISARARWNAAIAPGGAMAR